LRPRPPGPTTPILEHSPGPEGRSVVDCAPAYDAAISGLCGCEEARGDGSGGRGERLGGGERGGEGRGGSGVGQSVCGWWGWHWVKKRISLSSEALGFGGGVFERKRQQVVVARVLEWQRELLHTF
jgi:hypothetical protein